MKRSWEKYILVFILACMVNAYADGPALEVRLQKYAARPGEIFPVEYRVHWTGAPDAYVVLPPVLPQLEWGDALLLESRAHSGQESNMTLITVGYRASQKGRYTVPPLEIRVIERNSPASPKIVEQAADAPSLLLTSDSVDVQFSESRGGLILLVLFFAAVLLSGAVIWRVKIKKRDISPVTVTTPEEEAAALLHEARRKRLDGDYYEYYRTLRRVAAIVADLDPGAAESLLARMDQRVSDTGYRGTRPSDVELEGDFKDVEQLAARIRRQIS